MACDPRAGGSPFSLGGGAAGAAPVPDALDGGPAASVETATRRVHLRAAPGAFLASDPGGRVACVLHGELRGAPSDPAAEVAERYRRRGTAVAGSLHGSFAAVLVDREADLVLAITDRLNRKRIYHAELGGRRWLSTSLAPLPRHALPLDPVGVAWYLSNGVAHAGRTPYAPVRVLPRASTHTVREDGVESREYWAYRFLPGEYEGDEDVLAARLGDVIAGALGRALCDDPRPFLSLSGGYDSTTLAALVARHGARGGLCFSYVHGRPRPGSDAWVARRTARRLGLQHRTVESFRGTLVGHLRANALLGEGVAHCCDELDAWLEVADWAREAQGAVLLVGDHFMGDNPARGARPASGHGGGVREFTAAERLRPRLAAATYEAFREGVAADIARIRQQAPSGDALAVWSHFLLDQRIANTLMLWRESFPGRFMAVRNPLLDDELLDFMGSLPHVLRRERPLYQRAIRRMFPHLLAGRRARTGGYYVDLRAAFAREADEVRETVTGRASRLDALVPPDAALELLDTVVTEHRGRRAGKSLRGRALRAARRLLGRGRGRATDAPDHPPEVAPQVLLRRLLVLREAVDAP